MTKVKCPICGSMNVSNNGVSPRGVQRFLCNNKECIGKSFMLEYEYNGWKSGIEEQIINMTANSSGIRDIARVLRVSTQKVLTTIKKKNQ